MKQPSCKLTQNLRVFIKKFNINYAWAYVQGPSWSNNRMRRSQSGKNKIRTIIESNREGVKTVVSLEAYETFNLQAFGSHVRIVCVCVLVRVCLANEIYCGHKLYIYFIELINFTIKLQDLSKKQKRSIYHCLARVACFFCIPSRS